MNLNQLKYFHAICTLGSFSAAASYLYVSQPSLSAAIKELEREYGVTLLSRYHRGVVPTPSGERLFLLASDIIQKVDQAERELREMGKGKKLLRLGIPPMIGSLLLPSLYRDFVPSHPDLSLSLTEGGRQELLQRLDRGELDMVFLPHTNPFDKEYDAIPISRIDMVCCVSADSKLSKRSDLTPKDLEGVPLVLFEDGFFQTSLVKTWFAKKEVEPFVLLQTKQLSTMLSALSGGMAAGFCFSPLVQKRSDLVALSVKEPLWCRVSLVRRCKSELSEPMKDLSRFVMDHSFFHI